MRADVGFAEPEMYKYCEAENIDYTIALINTTCASES